MLQIIIFDHKLKIMEAIEIAEVIFIILTAISIVVGKRIAETVYGHSYGNKTVKISKQISPIRQS